MEAWGVLGPSPYLQNQTDVSPGKQFSPVQQEVNAILVPSGCTTKEI